MANYHLNFKIDQNRRTSNPINVVRRNVVSRNEFLGIEAMTKSPTTIGVRLTYPGRDAVISDGTRDRNRPRIQLSQGFYADGTLKIADLMNANVDAALTAWIGLLEWWVFGSMQLRLRIQTTIKIGDVPLKELSSFMYLDSSFTATSRVEDNFNDKEQHCSL